jgi:outer membrane receptor protein involved in Fe transport
LFALASTCVTRAEAQRASTPDAELSASARVAAPVTEGIDDPTASVTAIDTAAAQPGTTVADAIRAAPGARVSSAGGLGAFTTLSLRGSGPEHTRVLLDTIPLGGVDAGAFDLGMLPSAAFERIEVYRGGAPALVGDGAIGGTLRLVPARGHHDFARLDLGVGSFGRRFVAATSTASGDAAPRPAVLAHAALQHADDDYRYRDDALAFDDRDGASRAQRNARLDAGDLALHSALDVAGGRLSLLSLGHGRSGGLPGVLSAPTRDSHRSFASGLIGLSWLHEDRRADRERERMLQLTASAAAERDRVSDPFGELRMGIPTDGDDVTVRGFARVASALRVASWLEPAFLVSVAHEARSPSDRARFADPPRDSRRTTEAIALEPRVHGLLAGMSAELRPSARLELSQARIVDEDRDPDARDRHDVVAPTFRLAASLQPTAGLLFSASAATGKRVPTLTELFGDRAALAPSPQLTPERARMLDASAVLAGRAGELHGRAELRPFVSFIDDVIRYRRIALATVKAENLSSARLAGVELGASGSLYRRLSLGSSLTLLHSESPLGNALPLRPAIEAFVRPGLSWPLPEPLDVASIFVEAHHVGVLYLDDATNDTALPARTLLAAGAGVELLRGRLALWARLDNAGDTFASDVLGRPLPGRSFLVTASLREALP